MRNESPGEANERDATSPAASTLCCPRPDKGFTPGLGCPGPTSEPMPIKGPQPCSCLDEGPPRQSVPKEPVWPAPDSQPTNSKGQHRLHGHSDADRKTPPHCA
ncbi:hypothetical protein BV22DRAFT_737479 [Leucogyrophana mollusca]|uniref:Uncharacterized protein n=1 Tax=Leucogyrophana mollusca TaxID=85980 RepID=A0ACB8B800_9AGAM|nr:hypothetical protein BV22DRAFT_737479 [Leucogyrophana mollusca]